MDRRQIGTKLTLEALGRDLSLESFDDRLILQKTTYLVQQAGIELGYFYRWYLRGPYCPALTSDLYAMREELAADTDACTGWRLDQQTSAKLKSLSGLVRNASGAFDARDLELLASVHFLIKRQRFSPSGPADIQARLGRYGKDYSATEVTTAIARLKEHELIGG